MQQQHFGYEKEENSLQDKSQLYSNFSFKFSEPWVAIEQFQEISGNKDAGVWVIGFRLSITCSAEEQPAQW